MKDEYGALVKWYWEVKSIVLREEIFTVSLCPTKIQHGLVWD
jgi:hypothetical protein